MTEEKGGARRFILLMIGAILAFGTPYMLLVLDKLRIASPGGGLLLAILVLVVGSIMIYLSGKSIGMGD